MRLVLRFFLLGVLFLGCQFSAIAQPCGAFPLPPCDPGPPVPITGVELLIGAGALLGARKFQQMRRKQ